jgi:hypothetical protein
VEHLIDQEIRERGAPPTTREEVYRLWRSKFGGYEPVDPFSGGRYGYPVEGQDYRLWSVGPDETGDTGDDIIVRSGLGKLNR